jgi:cobalt-zinc-cadmium efflux system outer membrane protein
VAALEATQLRDQAAAALAQAKAQLAFLLGVRGPMPSFALDPHGLDYAVPAALALAVGSDPASPTAVPQSLIDTALEQRPDLHALTEQVKRAESSITLARRQRWGDPDLSVNYAQQGTGQNAITPPTLTVGLSVPVAILYQQQGEIAKAEADLRSQQVSLDKSRAQVASDVRQAYSAFVAARAQMERMDGRLYERAHRARDLIEVQYAKGAATLLDLLDAQRTLLAVSGERLNLLANYWNAVAQLEAAVAKELRT